MSQSTDLEPIPEELAKAFRDNPVDADEGQFVACHCFCDCRDCGMVSFVMRNPILKPLPGTEEILCVIKFAKDDIPSLIHELRKLL